MRFIHTADWHLGRVFFGVHMTEDQEHLLRELSRLIEDRKIECLVIAGDIYDRAVPPVDAVRLLDDFLYRTVVEQNVSVVILSGNHDSADRLSFASRLLERKGLYIASTPSAEPEPVVLEDAHGEVEIFPLPYFEPAQARQFSGNADIRTHADAMRSVVEAVRGAARNPARTVLAAHCFVEGGEPSESERPISVGGVESIPASVFRDFGYVALGHLHRPQSFTGGRIRYSGSLMRYSFSEADHKKSVSIVEMDGSGACSIEEVELTPRRQIRRITGRFAEILDNGSADSNREDYLLVELLDEEPIFEAMRKLREVYPNALHIERPSFVPQGSVQQRGDHRKVGPVELFSSFYRQTIGSELTAEQRQAFAGVLEALERQERELPV